MKHVNRSDDDPGPETGNAEPMGNGMVRRRVDRERVG
jgi:hypothetical protein